MKLPIRALESDTQAGMSQSRWAPGPVVRASGTSGGRAGNPCPAAAAGGAGPGAAARAGPASARQALGKPGLSYRGLGLSLKSEPQAGPGSQSLAAM